MAQLVPITAVRPSTYNPRETVPERLELIELSLRKLGWLIPIYATPDGEILSGHQRHLVAQRMGLEVVPVERVRPMRLAERKAVNIVFNRATNDLDRADTPAALTERLTRSGIIDLAATRPDLAPDDPRFYRCLEARQVPLAALTKANRGRWVPYAAAVAITLLKRGIVMPAICTRDLVAVNGIGRIEAQARRGEKTMPVVYIEDDEAELAGAMLNYLSMEFDIHTRYADLLRYNSFRRAHQKRPHLARGWTIGAIGKQYSRDLNLDNPRHFQAWARAYGMRPLDFGAGHGDARQRLAPYGVEVTEFEPYRLGPDGEIDKGLSLATARDFLDKLAGGYQFTSLVLASIFNSVPFRQDRRHILTILAAIAGAHEPPLPVYATASSTKQAGWRASTGSDFYNQRDRSRIGFKLDYEPGILVGDIGAAPKVQKYHTGPEWRALWGEFFHDVTVWLALNNVESIARNPRQVDDGCLLKALRFEFDLPYPDGTRMGLADQAIAAFEARLGRKLG